MYQINELGFDIAFAMSKEYSNDFLPSYGKMALYKQINTRTHNLTTN
jgi:hypothetical protein